MTNGVSEPYPTAPGVAAYQKLIAGGFTQQEANDWRTQQTAKLQAGGFKPSEIQDYWGNGIPANPEIAAHVARNFSTYAGQDPKLTQNPVEAFAAGWDRSVTGLVINQSAPSSVTPRDAGMVSQVANAVGQFAGDVPASVAGFFGGAAAGAAGGALVPGANLTGAPEAAGAVIGAGVGAGATPEAGRQILLDAYALRDGKIKTWGDATHVIASSLWETTKAGVVGGVTNLVGGVAGGAVLKAGGNALVAGGANAGAAVVSSVATASALDGHMPDAQDFTTAALLTLGLHVGGVALSSSQRSAASRVQANMENNYRQTGVPPWEQAQRAKGDPSFAEELKHQDVNGDPVNPNFRNAAPGDPPPFKPADRSTAGWAEPNVIDADFTVVSEARGPFAYKPGQRGPIATAGAQNGPVGQKKLPSAQPNQVYAKDVPSAMALLRQLEGSHDDSVSPAGALGRYQIMPGTARQYMGKDFDVTTLHDPAVNEQVANRIVTDLYKRYNGDMNSIAIAYNAGPGRAGQYAKAGPGTALVATLDKTVRSGVRYEAVQAAKDESFLPTETQRYLANARRRSGGDVPPPGDEPPPKFPSYELATQEGAGGGGGGEPPAVPPKAGAGGPEDEHKKFWARADEQSATDEILRNIGEQPDPNGKLVNLDRVLGQFVSELTPARRIDDRLVASGEMDRNRDIGAEDMFRQTYASDTRAGVFVRYGAVDPITLDIKPGSSSIMDAVSQVKKDGGDMKGWVAFMLAKRTVDKMGQGVATGFNPEASMNLASNKRVQAKYTKATAIFNDVMDSVLAYSQESGVHSAESVAAMKRDNPAYISMRRIMGDDEPFGTAGRGFQSRDSLRKMEGSDKQIVDPIMATLDNIRVMVKMADRNRAIGHIIGMVERGELSGLTKIEDSQTIKAADEKLFKAYGLPPEAASTYGALIAEKLAKSNGPNEFTYFRNGKPEKWRAASPELAELLRKADSPGQANIVMQTFQMAAKIERAGIVYMLDYPVRNVIRDQVATFISDPLHPPPFVTFLRGFAHVIGQSEKFQDVVAKGGIGAAMVDMDANYLARDMHKIFDETDTWKNVANHVKHPLEFFQMIAEVLDASNRVGYVLHAESKGIGGIKAATMGRKAYLDFAERGTAQIANSMAKTIPFWRATVLGLKQFGEAVRNRPVETLAYATASVAVPIAALYAINFLMDKYTNPDHKYEDLPRWVTDNYYVTPELMGKRLKLRIPQEYSFMAMSVTRTLDALAKDDKHAFEGWAKTFLDNYMPSLLPPLAQTPIEVVTNHSFFTGQPLIPASMEKNSGYMQYTGSTSETGKALSRALGPPGLNVMNFSPIQFDAYVKGWTGGAGGLVLSALDVPFHGSKKPWEIADTPFAGSFFIRNPGLSAQPIQNFYSAMDKLETKQADFALAMKRAEGGNPSEIDATAPGGQYAQAIAPIKQAIQVQAEAIRSVQSNAEMTDVEKRQAVDALMPQIIDTARQGVKAIDDINAQIKASKNEPSSGPAPQGPPAAPSLNAPAGRAPQGAAPPELPGANRGQVPMA